MWQKLYKKEKGGEKKLQKVEERKVHGGKEKIQRVTGEEVEIKEAVRKMKTREAAGVDGIPMKAWKFTGVKLWKK